MDYVQLLMIGWVILVKKVNQNAKKGPLSHQEWNACFWSMFNFRWSAKWSKWQKLTKKNEMLIFGLCSTSDDWPNDCSNESQPKCVKRLPKSSKNEMLIFGLCSTSDDQLSDPSDESQPKYVKRPPKSSKNEMLIFGLRSTSDDQPSDPSNESWQKCTTEVLQNDLEWPISPDLQLFQSFPTKVAQDNSEWQLHPIRNFSNLFPLKWLRMTWNG